MKLVRFGEPGSERPGVWLEDRGQPEILDVRAMAYDMADYDAHFFARWGLERLRGLLREKAQKRVPAAGLRLGPPVARPGKIVCIGKNYADHAVEFDADIPTAPVLFGKATTALIGPADPICIPPDFDHVDAEAELAVIIGRTARRVSSADAWSHIAGFAALNDVTERVAQRDGKQWFRGKSFDTFCPLGPWLVTPDEVGDPQALHISSRLNGRTLQEANTGTMLFPVAQLIAFISATITLEPGDVIATGTPSGVGFARKPPVFLRRGDTIEVGIEKLGCLRNPVIADA